MSSTLRAGGGEAALRVALFQFAPRLGDRAANLATIATGLAGLDAELVVLPELATSGYALPDREAALALAETPTGGPGLAALQALAESRRTAIAVGLPLSEGDRLYNAAALLRPGEAPVFYRKLHLFDREQQLFDPGDRPPAVTPVGALRVGLMICFDWVFPEVTRCLALAGADLIAHPSNLVLPGLAQGAMATRALENGVFAATANRVGEEAFPDGERLRFTGGSQLLDPRGRPLLAFSAEETRGEAVAIRPAAARDKRLTARNHLLADRRPALYTGLLEGGAPDHAGDA